MQHKTDFQTPELSLRAELSAQLSYAISQCHPEDAAQIMAASLDDLAAGDPPKSDPFGNLRADAAFWADTAHVAELEVYFAAALKSLGKRALGIQMRKRLFVAIWASLTDADRKAFLSRVDAQGSFLGRGAP